MPTYLLAFLLFFLPLVVLPFGISPYEIPKVILAEVGIEALLFYRLFQKGKLELPFSGFRLFSVFALVALTFTQLIFLRTETSFFGNNFRLQGIFLLWHMIIFSVLSSSVKLNLNPWIFYLSGIGLTLSVLILGDNGTGRLIGTLGEPNALAAAVVFLWPFIFFVSKLPVKILTLFIAIFIVLLSGSRSGLVAFFIQGLFLLVSQKINLGKAVMGGLIILALSFSLPFIEGGGWYENRAEVWQAALAAGWENPIFGGGFGNIEKLLPEGSKIVGNNARYQYVDSAHNIFLDFWVQGGLIGLFILGFLLKQAFGSFISQSKKIELTILLGLLAALSFNPVSVAALVQFWWLLGQGLGDAKEGVDL